MLDNIPQQNMVAASCGFNNYNAPIVSLQVIDDYINCAKWVFPHLWKHLYVLTGVFRHWKKADKPNIQQKKRQVLMQLFLLKRMRNFWSLKWWSLVPGIGYNEWGVGCTVRNAIKSFGMVSSARMRAASIATLFSKLVERQTALFSKEETIIIVIETYGGTLQLKHQCGEHLVSWLSGTHDMTMKVIIASNIILSASSCKHTASTWYALVPQTFI